jgi:hypothetical protein
LDGGEQRLLHGILRGAAVAQLEKGKPHQIGAVALEFK